MTKTIAIMALAGLAGAAHADLITASAFGPAVAQVPTYETKALGDVTNAVNGVFNAGGGAILNDAAHTLGTSEAMNAALRATTISSTVVTVGTTRTVTIEWSTDGGLAMVAPGDGLGGLPITTLSFENGSANAGGNGIDDPDFVAFNHAADPMNPGTFLADFDLIAVGGGTIFSGSYFVSLNAPTEVSGRTFIGAGGADLANFAIAGGVATISYEIVPAPASAALLGLGGFAAARRRR